MLAQDKTIQDIPSDLIAKEIYQYLAPAEQWALASSYRGLPRPADPVMIKHSHPAVHSVVLSGFIAYLLEESHRLGIMIFTRAGRSSLGNFIMSTHTAEIAGLTKNKSRFQLYKLTYPELDNLDGLSYTGIIGGPDYTGSADLEQIYKRRLLAEKAQQSGQAQQSQQILLDWMKITDTEEWIVSMPGRYCVPRQHIPVMKRPARCARLMEFPSYFSWWLTLSYEDTPIVQANIRAMIDRHDARVRHTYFIGRVQLSLGLMRFLARENLPIPRGILDAGGHEVLSFCSAYYLRYPEITNTVLNVYIPDNTDCESSHDVTRESSVLKSIYFARRIQIQLAPGLYRVLARKQYHLPATAKICSQAASGECEDPGEYTGWILGPALLYSIAGANVKFFESLVAAGQAIGLAELRAAITAVKLSSQARDDPRPSERILGAVCSAIISDGDGDRSMKPNVLVACIHWAMKAAKNKRLTETGRAICSDFLEQAKKYIC